MYYGRKVGVFGPRSEIMARGEAKGSNTTRVKNTLYACHTLKKIPRDTAIHS
jgi:hypothetical protein